MIKAAYVHIPFCEHICHYCDFNKVFLKNQPVDEYLDALEEEMKRTLSEAPTDALKTVFVGGGTPTALSTRQLERLLAGMERTLPLISLEEFTFEVNPDSVDPDKLAILKEYGVNRLSMGVQAFQLELLQEIGRTHDKNSVIDALKLSRAAGFSNISLDLMLGLPKQTPSMFYETLKEAFSLEVEHLSSYSLKVEEKTVFFNRQRKGQLTLPPEEDEVTMYEMLLKETEQHGYQQYEISNFAKKGFESKHNLVYWNNDEYYGFGAGAHGYVNGVRHVNHGPLAKYLAAIQSGSLPYLEENRVSKVEKMEEQMFMGLRKRSGVSDKTFYKRFGVSFFDLYDEQLKDLTAKGLIEMKGDTVKLTKQGMLLGNEVFEQFIAVIEAS